MVYSPRAPYEILSNRLIDADTMARLRRFARFWDFVANSGNFVESAPRLWQGGSPFDGFFAFAEWLYARLRPQVGHSAGRPGRRRVPFISSMCAADDPQATAETIWRDYQRGNRPDRPAFLSPYVEPPSRRALLGQPSRARRQARHQLS